MTCWMTTVLNRASSPISPTWAAEEKDGKCESSVYLPWKAEFAIFSGKKLEEMRKCRFRSNFWANEKFSICRFRESSVSGTPWWWSACLHWCPKGPELNKCQNPHGIPDPFQKSVWKLWKSWGLKLSINGNKGTKNIYMCVYVYVFMYIYIYTYTNTYAYTYTYTNTYTYTYIEIYIYIHLHIYIY